MVRRIQEDDEEISDLIQGIMDEGGEDSQANTDFFLDRGIVFLDGDVSERSARELKRQLLYLGMEGLPSDHPIRLFISTFGGESYDTLGILGTMRIVPNPIYTLALGKCMSAGAYILIAGDHRIALPHSRIMLHELSIDDLSGRLHDTDNDMKESRILQRELTDLVRTRTKIQCPKDFLKEDRYFSPRQALKYGIVDEVV